MIEQVPCSFFEEPVSEADGRFAYSVCSLNGEKEPMLTLIEYPAVSRSLWW